MSHRKTAVTDRLPAVDATCRTSAGGRALAAARDAAMAETVSLTGPEADRLTDRAVGERLAKALDDLLPLALVIANENHPAVREARAARCLWHCPI